MENIIIIKDELDCTIHSAFEMFTVNEMLGKWLTEKANIEARVGGKYELFWDPSNPEDNSTIGCKITGIELDRFISFEWKGPKQFKDFMNSADPLTHVVIFLSSREDERDKTNLFLFHSGWRKTQEWQEARNYFDKAWKIAIENLKKCFL